MRVVAPRALARADLVRPRTTDVDVDAELAHARAERGQREPPGAPAVGPRRDPLGVRDEHLAGHPRRDRVEPRVVAPRRVPLEERGVVRRARVDLRLIVARGDGLLSHEAVDHRAVSIDGEALEHRAPRHRERVDPLDGVSGGVEEGLFELGHREVTDDRNARVHALEREGPPRRALLVGPARGHRAEAHRGAHRHARREVVGEAARPVVEERARRDVGGAAAQVGVFARVHGALARARPATRPRRRARRARRRRPDARRSRARRAGEAPRRPRAASPRHPRADRRSPTRSPTRGPLRGRPSTPR